MKIKFIRYIVIALFPSLLALTSCEDMLNVDSARYQTVDGNTLSAAKDSVSSILGLLQGMQRIGERYILLGEMRADLLDVTDSTQNNIRQLSNYTVDSSNPYSDPRDYYSIINNCNYFISRTAGDKHPLKNENALAHAIRTWTYMQIAINWGKVYYFTAPLLSVKDTQKEFPVLDMKQLTDSLIADLEPFAEAVYPQYGTVYDFNSSFLFLPIKVLLGDLYLWRGSSTADFEKAADYYAQLINQKILTDGFSQPSINWSYENFSAQNFETSYPLNNWSSSTIALSSGSNDDEMFSLIEMASDASKGIVSNLPKRIAEFGASKVINNLWEGQLYTYNFNAHNSTKVTKDSIYSTSGDLRKQGNIMIGMSGSTNVTGQRLYKLKNADHILLYRMGLVYLRYAEALNRAGYSHTAFAVLKYGLNASTLKDSNKVPMTERVNKSFLNNITSLTYSRFDLFKGIHARGCGDVANDDTYKIESFKDDTRDTVQWVENAICNELALETSFEGNRLGDLMRIASRRTDCLPFYAKHIASKHVADYDRIYNLLSSDKKNWFLPEPSNK